MSNHLSFYEFISYHQITPQQRRQPPTDRRSSFAPWTPPTEIECGATPNQTRRACWAWVPIAAETAPVGDAWPRRQHHIDLAAPAKTIQTIPDGTGNTNQNKYQQPIIAALEANNSIVGLHRAYLVRDRQFLYTLLQLCVCQHCGGMNGTPLGRTS